MTRGYGLGDPAVASPVLVRFPLHPGSEQRPVCQSFGQLSPVTVGQRRLELPMQQSEVVPDQISEGSIGCAFRVMNAPGSGFLEKVYENTLAHALRKAGLHVSQQHAITARYDGVAVGQYAADLLVEGIIVVELKAVTALDRVHAVQSINYLKATGLRICLLLNFGAPHVEVQRIAN
jgi:GxxExxY protein